jgi:hypothetical protein
MKILDSVLIANECLNDRMRSGKPMVLCKLDIGNANNHINWEFFLYLLRMYNFRNK